MFKKFLKAVNVVLQAVLAILGAYPVAAQCKQNNKMRRCLKWIKSYLQFSQLFLQLQLQSQIFSPKVNKVYEIHVKEVNRQYPK